MKATLAESIDELSPDPFHLDGLFRPEWADKEGNLIAETLHVEKALARDHGKEVLKPFLHWFSG
jgi:hypothetical protein